MTFADILINAAHKHNDETGHTSSADLPNGTTVCPQCGDWFDNEANARANDRG